MTEAKIPCSIPKERGAFDGLLVPFTARCLNASLDELDQVIETGLCEVNRYFGSDRVLLWEISEDEQRAQLTHYYAEAGAEPPASLLLDETLPYIFGKLRDLECLRVPRLQTLPREAMIDRPYLERTGIRSFMAIPLVVGGALRGVLSLASVKAERRWSDKNLFDIERIGAVLSGVLDRKRWHQLLERRVQFETLITDLSARLIETPAGEVDGQIEQALARVREFFEADRCALLGLRDDPEFCWVTHAAYARGIAPVSGDINLAELFPWSYERLVIQGKPTRISSIEDLPPEAVKERKSRLAMGFRSAMGVPLFLEGKVVALIMINNLQAERFWPEAYVSRLRLLGEICVNALQRRNAELALRENQVRLRAQLEEIEQLKQKIESENLYLREEASLLFEHRDIVAESNVMKAVLAQVEQVARTEATVLITGETGTGKELVARRIHSLSARKNHPMVTVNCASLPPTLIESELFGREKGAYTGAMTRMAGRFEIADGSTLFLDEIAELPLDVQSKLLRVIEQGTFERLGSARTIHVNVRIVAATNRELAQEVRRGAFRQDLFYRLNVFPITLPALRDRNQDIAPLVWAFIRQFEKKMGKQIESIPQRSMEALQHYAWPGNVRELRNVIEHAMIVTRDKSLRASAPTASGAENSENGGLDLAAAERKHILNALHKCGWRVTGQGGAAEALGLKRTTLQSKMKKLGIQRPSN
ncbi:MAG: sigma 54-interacting transcriptional regulator [Desulfobacterales bacterium]|nr:sigma 54-interacting transcriptional regulator [Desulfobacterales bacterium]